MFTNTKYPVKKAGNYRYIYLNKERRDWPLLVCLHGMFGGLSNFECVLDRLKSRFRIYVPEIPLYSLSQRTLRIPGLREWLLSRMDNLSISCGIMLGNSMGGHIALDCAFHKPEYVDSLILTGSSGLFENEFGDSIPRRGDREYIRERAELTFYDSSIVDERLVDEIMEVINESSKLIRLIRLARNTHTYNMEDMLEDICQDTLLVWGREDKITPPEIARAFKRKLPNARLKWISQCGHAPMMEQPGAFLGAVEDFLEDKEKIFEH